MWLQEGLAKFLETRWRQDEPSLRYDPASSQLLRDAMQGNELLDFDQLHPSIALLPTQKAASLAFAQVSSFMQAYYRELGRDGVQQALYLVAEGVDARRALANVGGVSWKTLETRWKKALAKQPKSPPARLLPRYLSGEATEQDELAGVELERARNFVRLGDLLWTRSRPAAASVEYAKAHKAAPGRSGRRVTLRPFSHCRWSPRRCARAADADPRAIPDARAGPVESRDGDVSYVSKFRSRQGGREPGDRAQPLRPPTPLHSIQAPPSSSRQRRDAVRQARRDAGVMWQFLPPGAKRSP